MRKQDAVEGAIQSHDKCGGVWHVVKIGDGYYDVSQYWMDKPYNNEESLFQVGTIDSFPKKKLSVVGRVIVRFNKFLLWLFKPLIDGRRNKSNT